jgi:hypothetical protein
VAVGDSLYNPKEFHFVNHQPVFRESVVSSLSKDKLLVGIKPVNELVRVNVYFKSYKYFLQYLREQRIQMIRRGHKETLRLRKEISILSGLVRKVG